MKKTQQQTKPELTMHKLLGEHEWEFVEVGGWVTSTDASCRVCRVCGVKEPYQHTTTYDPFSPRWATTTSGGTTALTMSGLSGAYQYLLASDAALQSPDIIMMSPAQARKLYDKD